MSSVARIEQALSIPSESKRPGEVSFVQNGVQPPSQFYITQNVKVRVRSVTSQSNEFLTITAGVLVDNRIVPIQQRTIAFSATDTTVVDLPVTGFLVYVSLQCEVALLRCETYAVVELIDQNSGFVANLFSGYVTSSKPLSYPPISIEDSSSGAGKIRSASTLGNLPLSVTVPANRLWKLISYDFLYGCDATAANRVLNVVYTTFAQIFATNPLIANNNGRFNGSIFLQNGTVTLDSGTIVVQTGLISAIWQAGQFFTFAVDGQQAGDFVNTTIIYCYEEWLTL